MGVGRNFLFKGLKKGSWKRAIAMVAPNFATKVQEVQGARHLANVGRSLEKMGWGRNRNVVSCCSAWETVSHGMQCVACNRLQKKCVKGTMKGTAGVVIDKTKGEKDFRSLKGGVFSS